MRHVIALILLSCLAATAARGETYDGSPLLAPYPHQIQDGHVIPMTGYHQQQEWTCGPAACLMIEKFYFPASTLDEPQIATLVTCSETLGTGLAGMKTFFSRPGWTLLVKEETDVNVVLRAIRKDVPTIVGWSDWGGHWAIPVGYDYRTKKDDFWQDDLIIFRDPYDQVDGTVDGYTDFALARFTLMWEEHTYITPGRKNVRLLLIPVPAAPAAHPESAKAASGILNATD